MKNFSSGLLEKKIIIFVRHLSSRYRGITEDVQYVETLIGQLRIIYNVVCAFLKE